MQHSRYLVAAGLSLFVAGCNGPEPVPAKSAQVVAATISPAEKAADSSVAVLASDSRPRVSPRPGALDTAMFAGGCFWSMERPFQHVPGVRSTAVGYAGGHTKNPTYEEVNTRTTGHTETVRVVFDPAVVSYEKLLDVYWHNIDPVTKDRQFCDGGNDYRTAIFTRGSAQHAAAVASKTALDKSGHFKTPIVTEIVREAPFWMGEEYHQHFADRNPDHYNAYRRGCRRDERLHELWGDSASPYVPKN